MLEKLLTWDPRNHEWMERASEVLKRDICAHYKASNSEIFAHNRDVQIGMFLANHMHWQNLEREGISAGYSAGLSLGEYNHLVHIGALEFDDAVRVLAARGEAYEQGPRGKMTAVFPVEADDIRKAVQSMGCNDQLGVGMINTPRQCVLSGDAGAVDKAAGIVEEEFLAEAVVIEERLPMHSPLFRAVGDQLRPALEEGRWHVPDKPYLPNLTGKFEKAPPAGVFVDTLSRHTWSTVRWRDCIETLVAESSGMMTFVETGPKSVLTKFFGRKWVNPDRFHTDAETDFESALERLIKEIRNGFAGVETDR
jgi:[acyl-carrier-protein] S-malonyltransferase